MNVNLAGTPISLSPLPLAQHLQSTLDGQDDHSRPSSHSSRRGTPSSMPQHRNKTPVGPGSETPEPSSSNGGAASTSYEYWLAPLKTTAETIARRVHHGEEEEEEEEAVDIELQETFPRSEDPFDLQGKKKTDSEIISIRTNITRRGSNEGPIKSGKTAWRARKVANFYFSQNENIERLLKPVEAHRREARMQNDSSATQYKIAVHASFAANLCLAILQVFGAVSSGSLSLFTTMADALFDPLSNVTLILSRRAVNRVDPRRFPSGKARIETAGNILFCFLMTSVSFILIAMSARELAEGSKNKTTGFHIASVVAVAVAFVTKLALFCYCFTLRNRYSQIRILWEDHRNDLIINGFGLLTSVGGSKLRWWIDPMGAVILSCLIAVLWLRTAYSEFQLLIGVSADTEMLQLITYISMTHSDEIQALDTVRAYHSGPRLIVEVDIVMDPAKTLRATHDVAEELQMKLESLPGVERAYVHVDFETSHAPEHFLKKEI